MNTNLIIPSISLDKSIVLTSFKIIKYGVNFTKFKIFLIYSQSAFRPIITERNQLISSIRLNTTITYVIVKNVSPSKSKSIMNSTNADVWATILTIASIKNDFMFRKISILFQPTK